MPGPRTAGGDHRRLAGDPRYLPRGPAPRRGNDVGRGRRTSDRRHHEETVRLADLIEGVAGEWSPFELQHGFSIDGVDLDTAILPDGWRDRLVKVQNANTAAPAGEPRFAGWCLDKDDLCVAKLCAFREKDRNFVAALVDAGLVDADLIGARILAVPREHIATTERALAWLKSKRKN